MTRNVLESDDEDKERPPNTQIRIFNKIHNEDDTNGTGTTEIETCAPWLDQQKANTAKEEIMLRRKNTDKDSLQSGVTE